MPASSAFFGQRNAKAVLKHGVLARYAYYFAGRAGHATGGRVAFIDGYAGEGRYEDGSPGSPLLLASEATRAKMFGRDIKLAFVEKDDSRRARLGASLDADGVDADKVVGGELKATVDDLLARYSDRATLLFVDPFGLAFSRPTLERILALRNPGRPIDVLYHFSLSAVARMASAAIASGTGSEHNGRRLDTALGNLNWRSDFTSVIPPHTATSAALSVARRFGAAVEEAVHIPSIGIPVRQRPEHLPVYLLMLFTANAEARWYFADAAGNAHVDWLLHCNESDYEANLRRDDEAGRIPLFDLPSPERRDVDERLEQRVVPELVRHLGALFHEHGRVRLIDYVQDAYGEYLGVARVRHLRAALRELHSQGVISDDAKRDFWRRDIQ